MQDWLEPLAGAIVLVVTLLDVFLTVLYARAGTGLLAPRLARGVWGVFRALSGRRHAGMLTYCGPVQLVALVLMWGVLLALGAGLVIHPALGTGVKASSGPTDTDFVTALFVGGSSRLRRDIGVRTRRCRPHGTLGDGRFEQRDDLSRIGDRFARAVRSDAAIERDERGKERVDERM